MGRDAERKMVYVAGSAATWWERGEKLAAGHGMSMSKYIAYLLRREVMAAELKRSGGRDKPKTFEMLLAELAEARETVRRIEEELVSRIEAAEEVPA